MWRASARLDKHLAATHWFPLDRVIYGISVYRVDNEYHAHWQCVCVMGTPTTGCRASRDCLTARRLRPAPKWKNTTLRSTKINAQNKFRRIEGLIRQRRQF
jgi:hypothetical protein